MAQKAKEIISNAIAYLQESKSSHERLLSTSSSVIQLTNLDPESVPPIPSRLKSKPSTLKEAYVSTCLSSWKSEKREALLPRQFGFDGADDFSQFISLICDSIDVEHIANWLSEEFPDLGNRETRYYTRRYLCIAINEKLSGKSLTAENQYSPIENCLAKLKEYEVPENSGVSPHYDSIIFPFIKKLESVSKMELNERGELPGDVDLIQISQDFAKN